MAPGIVEGEFGLQLEEDSHDEGDFEDLDEDVVLDESQTQEVEGEQATPSSSAKRTGNSKVKNAVSTDLEDDDVEIVDIPDQDAAVVGLQLAADFRVSPVPEKCKNSVPCILGIDEAGRGPVLGPMVYAAAYWPKSEAEAIDKLGFNDSKQLKEEDRERFYKMLGKEADRIGHVICDLPAEHISANMMLRTPVSLNVISHSSAIEMIKRVIEQGVNVAEIYVDAVGNCEWYENRLSKIFPHAQVTVRAKADAIYKVVGAASIYAKVTRDRALKDWVFREHYDENGKPLRRKRQLQPMECSGYPSDERTTKWLRENADAVFGFPSVVRFSWKTARQLLGEYDAELDAAERIRVEQEREISNLVKFVRVEWESQEEQSGTVNLSSMFKSGRSARRNKYFKDRRMHSVSSF